VAGGRNLRRQRANPRCMCTTSGLRAGGVEALDGNVRDTEDEIDRLLRAGVMVDLHQALQAKRSSGVEEYSLKKWKRFMDSRERRRWRLRG